MAMPVNRHEPGGAKSCRKPRARWSKVRSRGRYVYTPADRLLLSDDEPEVPIASSGLEPRVGVSWNARCNAAGRSSTHERRRLGRRWLHATLGAAMGDELRKVNPMRDCDGAFCEMRILVSGKGGRCMTSHWLAAAAMLLAMSEVVAGDIKAGEIKTVLCAACHAHDGISINDNWPNLAGQKEAYLIKQLKDFREGRRGGAVMPEYTQRLSDQDIEDLAAYYSSLEPCSRRQADGPAEPARW